MRDNWDKNRNVEQEAWNDLSHLKAIEVEEVWESLNNYN